MKAGDVTNLHWKLILCAVLLGWEPVSASPAPDPSERFSERIDQATRALQAAPKFENVPYERLRGAVEFVIGQVLYAVLHEMGHAVITEMQLPVLGKEEDAADAFAITSMIKIGGIFSDRILTESALGWYLSDVRDQKEGIKPTFYDSHGLDKQRAYWIVCLMVGSDQQRFKALADRAKIPAARQESCTGDYGNASWSWDKSLKPFRREANQAKPDSAEIVVVYDAAPDDLSVYAQSLQAVRMLESVAEHAKKELVWKSPIKMEMKSCGRSNAYWLYGTHTITICYELAREWAELYRDYGQIINPIVSDSSIDPVKTPKTP